MIMDINKYQTPYPPLSDCVYEYEQIHDIWHHYPQLGKPKNKRLKVLLTLLLEPQYLQLDVAEDQNYTFVDSKTKDVVMLIVRNWTSSIFVFFRLSCRGWSWVFILPSRCWCYIGAINLFATNLNTSFLSTSTTRTR